MINTTPTLTPELRQKFVRTIAPFPATSWVSLTGKQKWDVMSSMRGPDRRDTAGSILKWLTTSVLRMRMCECFRVGGMLNTCLSVVVLPDRFTSLNPESMFDASHFLSHIRDAAHVVGVPILSIDSDLYRSVLEGGRAGMDFWDALGGYEMAGLSLAWNIVNPHSYYSVPIGR